MIDTYLEYRRLTSSGHTHEQAISIIDGLKGVTGENISFIKELRIEHRENMAKINENMLAFATIKRDVHYIWLGIVTGFAAVISMLGILLKS